MKFYEKFIFLRYDHQKSLSAHTTAFSLYCYFRESMHADPLTKVVSSTKTPLFCENFFQNKLHMSAKCGTIYVGDYIHRNHL